MNNNFPFCHDDVIQKDILHKQTKIRVTEAARKFEIKFNVLNVPLGVDQIWVLITESLNKDRVWSRFRLYFLSISTEKQC